MGRCQKISSAVPEAEVFLFPLFYLFVKMGVVREYVMFVIRAFERSCLLTSMRACLRASVRALLRPRVRPL